MEKSQPIPGFLSEDYDEEDLGLVEKEKLTNQEKYWLHHDQVVEEDGIALGEKMSAEYDSYIIIGFKKERHDERGVLTHYDSVTGACHVDLGDYDAVYEMARLLGEYAYDNYEVAKILFKALKRYNDYKLAEENPEPPVHDLLPQNERFHLNRYKRILSEEMNKVRDEFFEACDNYKLRHDMKMKMVLTAIADQVNDNEYVDTDFFCNFVLGEKSKDNNVDGIDVWLQPYPCSWQEADEKRFRFIELCEQYGVPCHIEGYED